MIVLHIGYDGVVCYQIMKYAIRVNSAFCIAVFPFRMNVTYLQYVFIISRKWYNEYTMLPMYMLVFVHVSLGCRRLTVLFDVFLWNCVPHVIFV